MIFRKKAIKLFNAFKKLFKTKLGNKLNVKKVMFCPSKGRREQKYVFCSEPVLCSFLF